MDKTPRPNACALIDWQKDSVGLHLGRPPLVLLRIYVSARITLAGFGLMMGFALTPFSVQAEDALKPSAIDQEDALKTRAALEACQSQMPRDVVPLCPCIEKKLEAIGGSSQPPTSDARAQRLTTAIAACKNDALTGGDSP